MSKVMPYEAWRITYQSSEQAARAAYEAMVELQGRATTISESDRLELTGALGLLRGHQYHGCADALERVLRGAGSPAAVQQGVDLPDVEDMAHSALEEALSFGLSHDVLHRWMKKVMRLTQEALATHPTQQGLDALAQTLGNAFITSESDGATGNYKLIAKFKTLPELQAAHSTVVTTLAAQAKQGEQANG